MTARTLFLPPAVLAAVLLVAAACGGNGEEAPQPGRLSDPRSVPTATPWAQAPEPIILEPDILTPIANGSEGQNGGGGEAEVEVTPVEPFQVTSEESTNLRIGPSTDSGIVGTLKAGQEATVVGQVQGEEVTAGVDLWFQLEDGSFVYSGAVSKVE